MFTISFAACREIPNETQDNLTVLFKPVADPGFPRGGGANSPGGAPTYDFAKFSKNWMKLKEFGPPGGGARVQNFTM